MFIQRFEQGREFRKPIDPRVKIRLPFVDEPADCRQRGPFALVGHVIDGCLQQFNRFRIDRVMRFRVAGGRLRRRIRGCACGRAGFLFFGWGAGILTQDFDVNEFVASGDKRFGRLFFLPRRLPFSPIPAAGQQAG